MRWKLFRRGLCAASLLEVGCKVQKSADEAPQRQAPTCPKLGVSSEFETGLQ